MSQKIVKKYTDHKNVTEKCAKIYRFQFSDAKIIEVTDIGGEADEHIPPPSV